MNILITGGAGYIGSHVVLKLKEAGHFTVVYDNLSKGFRELVNSDAFVDGDIHDKSLLDKTIKKHKIEAIMHFAAFIEVGESMKDPKKYFENNSAGTINLLNAAIENKARYFVFSSTAALFGHPEEMPITENCPFNPINAYGESKLIVEKVLKRYSQAYDFNYVSLRYFNACGADKQLRTGECHNPETHLIPIALQTAYGKRDKMFIYGTDYNTKDGTCIRDYVHVEDLADAHVLALAYMAKNNKSEVFNLGSGNGYSVKEVIDAVKKITGKDFAVVKGERRAGDPAVLIASSEKIKKVLGWKPKYTIKDAIKTASDWFIKREKLNPSTKKQIPI
ncbi:ADP-L-glycero-D-manno-heptose-6-epimerase [uncultured archaeon]|nr:ADP-L-glycero-D-manno-heptose-6-epimerase [uncultured archaeon]